jgi:hypothetical protein
MSPNKAQLSLTQVTYLSLTISPTHRAIIIDHKALLVSLPVPTTKAEILSFLSLVRYLRAWVPNFSLMVKPLYETSRGPIQEPLDPSWPVSGHLKPSYKPCSKPWCFACRTSLVPFSFTF